MNIIEVALTIGSVLQGVALSILTYKHKQMLMVMENMGLFILAMAKKQMDVEESEVVFTQ